MQQLQALEDVKQSIAEHPLTLLILKTRQCGVCEAVQAKADALLQNQFSNINGIYLYVEDAPESAAEFLAFSSPLLLLFYEGKEVYRAARFILFDELEHILSQYYELLNFPS
ncbi:thioredoxin family protein [Paenibacillus sp. IITD108]|uniref:thioredoxin family protein n=1 Tax=Paenibacillus sp. IITD108 TaxID=3116649 RepID=UPI002F40243C